MTSMLSTIIDRHVPIIAATALVAEAIAVLGATEHSCILVVETEQSQLIGLFTERDVVRLMASGTQAATCLVPAAMSEPSVTLSESNLPEVDDVLALFKRYHLNTLPIVNEQAQPVGVITATSLLQRLGSRTLDSPEETPDRCQSEERWQLVIQASNDGIFDLDLTTGYCFYSERFKEILGYAGQEFAPTREQWYHLLHPDDRDYVVAAKEAYLHRRIPHVAHEYRLRCRDGSYKWVLERLLAVWNEAGDPVRVVGVSTNISDRKQAEIILAKRDRYLAILVEIQNLLLASTTDQTYYTEILRQLGLASGASRVYLFENHWDAANNLLMSQRAEWCAKGITPEINNPILQNLAYQDSFPRWAAVLSRGEIINGSVAEFPESERQLLEPMGVLSVLILPLMVGGRFFGFIGFDNCVTAHAWESLEISLLSAAASAISLHQQRKQAEESLAVLLVQTQEQSLALAKARDAAEAANRAKSEFLANMSHELRTPLNAILGFTQIMSHDKLLSPDNQEYVNIINRSGQHLLELINDVLEMSKIEAGRLKLHPISFDLYYLLDTLYEMLHLKASAKRLLLTFDRPPNLPQYITTDEGKLRQVLLNLLDNAIKFTQSGHVALRVKVASGGWGVGSGEWGVGCDESEVKNDVANILPSTLNPQPSTLYPLPSTPSNQPYTSYTLQFEVEDTGFGIAPTDLKRLFRPFVQTHTGYQTAEGTGLGLTISQKFVQLMGGEITVESVFGQGSTFRFSIQTTLAQEIVLSVPYSSQRVIGLAPGQPNYRLLIVEDRWENQQILVKMLQPLGFEIQIANNGQEGIAVWEQWQPHGILMDMRMPVMSGYEATRQIRAQERDSRKYYQDGYDFPVFPCLTKIIAVTSSAFSEDRSAMLELGCDDFISKPFREKELLAKLAQHLGVHYLYDTQPVIEAAQREQQDSLALISQSVDRQAFLDALCLGGMSREWILQLHQAAILGKDRQMLSLIDQIPDTSLTLVQALRELVNNFRFEEIVDLTTLNPLEERH